MICFINSSQPVFFSVGNFVYCLSNQAPTSVKFSTHLLFFLLLRHQLYKVKITFLGTSPPDFYTAQFQFKSPMSDTAGSSPSRFQGNLPNQQQRTLGSKPTTKLEIADITITHSASEWKVCYIQK